jgi:hypothetical protein
VIELVQNAEGKGRGACTTAGKGQADDHILAVAVTVQFTREGIRRPSCDGLVGRLGHFQGGATRQSDRKGGRGHNGSQKRSTPHHHATPNDAELAD